MTLDTSESMPYGDPFCVAKSWHVCLSLGELIIDGDQMCKRRQQSKNGSQALRGATPLQKAVCTVFSLQHIAAYCRSAQVESLTLHQPLGFQEGSPWVFLSSLQSLALTPSSTHPLLFFSGLRQGAANWVAHAPGDFPRARVHL